MFLLLPSRTITAFQDPSSPTFVTFNDFLLFQDTTATYIGGWSKTHSMILQRYVNPEPTHPISPRCRALRCKWSLDTEGTVWLEHPRLRFLWHLESQNCKRVYSLGVRISDEMFHTACWHILVLCVLKLLWRHGGVNGGLKEGLILALFSQASRESREDGWMLMQQFLRFRGPWIYFLGKCIRHYKVPDAGSICVSMVEWHLYIHCWIKLPFLHWSTQTSQELFSVHWGDSVAAVLCLCSAGCWLLRGGYSHSFRYWECGLAYLHIFLLHHDVLYLLLFGVWNLQSRRSAPSQGTQGSVMSGCKWSQTVRVGSANWDNGRRSTACKQKNIRMGLGMTEDWIERWVPPGEQSLYIRSVDLACNSSASLSWCVQM